MQQSQSDSGKTYPSVDQPLYASASPYRPAKRVRRLLHDSKPETSLEKVFCEYDWHRQRFSSTLRDVSAPQHHSPRLPSQNISTNDKMIGGISSENLQDSSPGQQPFSSRTSCAVPRSCASQIPDETIVSKCLLSASPSSTPSALNLADNDDHWVSNVFSTSPISQAEPTLSPLQQSIMAFAEQDRVALRADIHATPSQLALPKTQGNERMKIYVLLGVLIGKGLHLLQFLSTSLRTLRN
ncbi:hypothetical protein CPB84DRAFT_766791 [Gymnopilus junonius]|uniref:Uncharacterized protein n=1 Tax=Gymnopilus junonius TaxID=109634 RepID=A0A9P5NX92_GYMJU|nr:hypothetical protein CPB84DRAFT_766791 [Gymnopilus junonius]